jgi:nicotinamidase-related amidase
MKKMFTLFTLLLLIVPGKSYSQENVAPDKKEIKPALLIIDIQNAYLDMIPERDKEVALYMINAYIDLFRSHGFPVIRVYQYSKEYGPEKGTEGFEFPESVKIVPEDAQVIKTYPDGFNKTDLDQVIKATGSNTLFLTGLSAVGCVLATWIGAQNNDYIAFLVKDAIMSHNSDYTDNVEVMFDAIGYDVVKLLLETSEK